MSARLFSAIWRLEAAQACAVVNFLAMIFASLWTIILLFVKAAAQCKYSYYLFPPVYALGAACGFTTCGLLHYAYSLYVAVSSQTVGLGLSFHFMIAGCLLGITTCVIVVGRFFGVVDTLVPAPANESVRDNKMHEHV